MKKGVLRHGDHFILSVWLKSCLELHHAPPQRIMKLATCLLNISEARSQETIRRIIMAGKASIEASGEAIQAAVLNAFLDTEYNRTVITIRSVRLPSGLETRSDLLLVTSTVVTPGDGRLTPC